MTRKLKTIRSHTGYAIWLNECETDPNDPELCLVVGYLPRHRLPAESRYSYSPAYRVYCWEGKSVIGLETSHKVYEVWEMDARDWCHTEERATECYIQSLKALPGSGPIRHAGRS